MDLGGRGGVRHAMGFRRLVRGGFVELFSFASRAFRHLEGRVGTATLARESLTRGLEEQTLTKEGHNDIRVCTVPP